MGPLLLKDSSMHCHSRSLSFSLSLFCQNFKVQICKKTKKKQLKTPGRKMPKIHFLFLIHIQYFFSNLLDNTSKETMRQLQQLWVKFLEQKLAHMEYTQNVSRWHQSL
jgi:hypothetical protein